jgi:ketosteroid isomerase-like protein
MSGERVEDVRAIYEEWRKGNFRAGVDLYDPSILLVHSAEFPDAGSVVGPEAVGGFMRAFLEAWEKVTIEAEDLIDAGDSVVAAVVQRGTGKASGAEPAELHYFHVWTFRADRVIRLDVIRDRTAALQAAGVRE